MMGVEFMAANLGTATDSREAIGSGVRPGW